MTEISPLGARRRRILPKVLIAVAVAVAAALVAGTIYAFQVDRSITQNITRQDDTLPDDSPTGLGQSPRPTKDPAATGTLNYVLLGSDSRDPNNEGAGRSDSIMLVHLNAKRDMAYIISFPRDMYVQIPGYGRNKINAAFAFGGPKLIVTTLENLTGDRMDHIALVDFQGFIQLTNDLGGVTVYNKTDFSAHGYHFPQGDITIKGEQALYFVRERHQLPRGDFDRSANQQELLRSILRKVRVHQSEPGFMERGLLASVKFMDTDLSPAELYRLAQAVTAIRPGGLRGCVISGPTGDAGGASVVFPDVAQARRLGDDARRDGTLNHGC